MCLGCGNAVVKPTCNVSLTNTDLTSPENDPLINALLSWYQNKSIWFSQITTNMSTIVAFM